MIMQHERRAAQLQALQAARSQRAYEVAETYHIWSPRPGAWRLVGPEGQSYVISAGRCSCEDAKWHPELRCKHCEALELVREEKEALTDYEPLVPSLTGEWGIPDEADLTDTDPVGYQEPSDEVLTGVVDGERRVRIRAERALWS